MSKKQVYAVLEFNDYELKLLVCEFLDSKLNVLHKEKDSISGILNNVIIHENDVVGAITNILDKTKETLGFSIDRVLLSIPSISLKNVTKRVNVFMDSFERKISIEHIKKGISDLLDFDDENLIPVNLGSIRYITNGIISRRMPLNETCDVLVISADVLYASKDIVYSYVSCVESAGIEVMDICLDSFAAAEETSIVRKMDSKYVVGVKVDRNVTVFTLFEKDRILSSQTIPVGYSSWISNFVENHDLKPDVVFRLLRNNIPFETAKCDDHHVFAYQRNDKSQVILSQREVCSLIEKEVAEYMLYIKEVCSGIVAAGDTKFVFYGEGSDFEGLKDVLHLLEAESLCYVPEVLGARESTYTSMLGIFYVWNEQHELKNDYRSCSDYYELEKNEVMKKKVELGLTQRLKKALMIK